MDEIAHEAVDRASEDPEAVGRKGQRLVANLSTFRKGELLRVGIFIVVVGGGLTILMLLGT